MQTTPSAEGFGAGLNVKGISSAIEVTTLTVMTIIFSPTMASKAMESLAKPICK